MLRLCKARLGFLWFLLGILLVGTQSFICPMPDVTLTVSPTPTTTICSGSVVSVTINSAESGILYELRNNATNAPLSGSFSGTGSDLTINKSNAIASNVTIKVHATKSLPLCEVDLSDLVGVIVDQVPTVATTGLDQALCSTTATLTGNTPPIGAGQWTIVSGAGGAFVDANNPTTNFYGVTGTTYVLRWTISNGVCASTNDDVQITFNTPPIVALAGPDQTLCSASATLAGNTPGPGTGQWTIFSGGPGSFVSATNPTTTFTGTPGTTYVLEWTITNGVVCTPSVDQVTIKLDANPTPAALAGSDQTLCSTSATLAGNTPGTGMGTWTVVSGAGGSFVNANSPTTVFNGVTGTTYNLRWTISNGVCASTNDDVQITFNTPPTVALAGPDQTLCSAVATLAGNTPGPGTGQWTIFSGEARKLCIGYQSDDNIYWNTRHDLCIRSGRSPMV